jgi:tetratricopeptide (TPR) repeat protein
VAATWPDPVPLLEQAAQSALDRSLVPNRFEIARRSLLQGAVVLAQAALSHRETARALELRGRSRYRLDPQTERAAFSDWERALALEPSHLQSRLRMAEYYYDLRFWDDSVTHAQVAHRAHPGSAEAATALGKALARGDRAQQAVAVLAPLVQADPAGHNPAAWLFLGVAQHALGDPAALATLGRYLRMRPAEPRARRDLVAALRRAGRLDEADRHERWLEARSKADRTADGANWATAEATRRVERGDAAGAEEHFDLAETRWRAAIAAYPFVAEYHKRLFYLLRQRGEYGPCEEAARVMLQRFPRSRWAATHLAFMLELRVRRGEIADPAAALEEAAAAIERTLPYSAYRFSSDDLRMRVTRLRHWSPRAGAR